MKEVELKLTPKQAAHEEYFLSIAAKILKSEASKIKGYKIIKKSIDARNKSIKVNMKILISFDKKLESANQEIEYKNVENQREIIIIGAGPAGLFAALRLIELGLKPIVLERGKAIKERRLDIAKINREHLVNPESNYAFGEGGAGTFSDGKLYTRSKKRGSTAKILEILQAHGAHEDILYESHPHIGTNKLPDIIKNIRETIINAGGQILFNTKATDLIITDNQIKGVITEKNEKILSDNVILATGHSANDIYELLHKKNVTLESKSFAIGVRIEHQQSLIDSIQYSCDIRDEHLPAAAYKLVNQVKNRGVYSFCMCPGGFIVPASTHPERVVVNGMSPSKRDSKFANSGMVVEIKPEDVAEYSKHGVLAGLKYQQNIENLAFLNSNKTQAAPAQRMNDFIKNRFSNTLPETSYVPGTTSSNLHEWLPKHISYRLQQSFKFFGKKMNGYLTNEAIILGVESRTSSPLRIPRNKETLQHVQVKGLYPCGEGAGYAGGIVSAAIDGENCASKIFEGL